MDLVGDALPAVRLVDAAPVREDLVAQHQRGVIEDDDVHAPPQT